MAFLTYKKTVSGSNVRYERLAAIKLGGRDGLIAKHVKTLTDETARSWRLESAALLQLAGMDSTDTIVLFDVTGEDSTSVCFYEIVKIHGSCRDTSTQLALDMAVVVDKEIGDDASAFAKFFELPVSEKPRQLGETLSLSGGPGGGDWKWGSTALQIGATVVQAQHSHGHGSGEPCPNCTCGKRATAA